MHAHRYFQYAWVATSNLTGGAGTLANNIGTIRNSSPFANWPGGIGDTISGSMNTMTPEIVNYSGRLTARLVGHPLTTDFSFSQKNLAVAKFDGDLKDLRTADDTHHAETQLQGHAAVYNTEFDIFTQHFATPKSPKGTVGRVVGNFGSAAGGAGKLVNGISVLAGSYRYPKNATKRFEVFGAGGIVYGAGVAVSEEETIRRELLSEIKWHKLAKDKRPSMILKKQLTELNIARADLSTQM